MFTSFLYLGAFAAHASALAFKGPQATSQAEAGELVFPPQPTEAPKVHPDLLRRGTVMTDLIAPDNTCGYVSGLTDAAYTCNPDTDICAFFPGTSTTYGFIGCCNPTNFNCGARATCINSRQYYSSSICDNSCQIDTHTLKCTASAAPYCNGIRFPVEGVEDYFCDVSYVSTWQTAFTTYNFENDGRAFSPLVVTLTSAIPTSGSSAIPLTVKPTSFPKSISSSSSSSSNGSGGQSSNGSGGQSSSSNGGSASTVVPGGQSTTPTPAPVPSSSSGTPIGAIVGGAVGGALGLALIGLAVFFILRHNKKKNEVVAANTNNGVPPPTYMPPQDSNNTAYAATNAGKPGPTTQETAMAGHWAPTQNQYPPPMQEQPQQQYPPQHQQYSPQPETQQYQQQQQYSPPMQQQQTPYPSMAEVQGSYGQPHQQQQQQNTNSAYYSQNQTPNQHYSTISDATQLSPNSQSHLSSTFPDRADATSPLSAHQASELGVSPGGETHAPHSSPAPTFVSSNNMGTPAPTSTQHVAAPRGVEGRSEMSANMAGRPFPINAYEVPGSETYHH